MTDIELVITPKKRINLPPITLGYGEPGIGKTTWASQAPDALFICVERGANEVDVQRLRVKGPEGERDPQEFEEVNTMLGKLVTLSKLPNCPFKTVVIDTLDALEAIIHKKVCEMFSKPSIALINYGKGFDSAIDHMRTLLAKCERLKDNGIHVVLLAHAKLRMFNNPEGADFNFWDLKLHEKLAGLLVETCDNVLFMRREAFALEEGGKVRGVGTGARFIHTQKSPAFVAKNRFKMPEKIPLDWQEYENAMKEKKPADPEELRAHAAALIEQLPSPLKEEKSKVLQSIGPTDAPTLVKFVDFLRAKVNTHGTEQKETNK
jgi:AAA domain-containing protein